MPSPPAPLIRLAGYYFFKFGALGALLPFLPLLFARRGMSPSEISWVMVLVPIGNLTVPPLWGVAADAWRARVTLLGLSTIGAAATLLLLIPAAGLRGTLAAMALFCLFRAPTTALADAVTHDALGDDSRAAFGRVRAWGSVGFALLAWSTGRLGLARRAATLLPVPAAALGLAAATTVGLRVPPARRETGLVRRGLAELRDPTMLLLIAGTTIYYGGHACYDVYYALHLDALGFDAAFVGTAWAVGVAVEVVVMLIAPPMLRRVRARHVLTACSGVAALRWTLISRVRSARGLLAIQPLHALTFGLWYLALVKEVQDRAPDALRASMQSVMFTATGLGMTGGYLIGGVVFERSGGQTLFGAVALLALVAGALYAANGGGPRRLP